MTREWYYIIPYNSRVDVVRLSAERYDTKSNVNLEGFRFQLRASYVSVAFFPSLKHNFISYRSSKESSRPDWIFEIHQLWQSGFIKGYFNCCCSCSFKCEIIKICQSSHKMYSNNILNFQESTTILNACKKILNLIESITKISSSTDRLFHCITTLQCC